MMAVSDYEPLILEQLLQALAIVLVVYYIMARPFLEILEDCEQTLVQIVEGEDAHPEHVPFTVEGRWSTEYLRAYFEGKRISHDLQRRNKKKKGATASDGFGVTRSSMARNRGQ